MLPVLLNVAGRRCVVVGGGAVGVRKARTLLEAGAEVIILSPSAHNPPPEAQHQAMLYSLEALRELRPWLVVAATNDAKLNLQINDDARAEGILTMLASDPAAADLQSLMSISQGEVLIAASTGSPYFTRHLLNAFADQISAEWLILLAWLKALRPHAKMHIPTQAERAKHWEAVYAASDEILAHLRADDRIGAKGILGDILGAWAKDHLETFEQDQKG